MNSEMGATVTPQPDGSRCDVEGCETNELLALVEPDTVDEQRVLCPIHRVAYLREVSTR